MQSLKQKLNDQIIKEEEVDQFGGADMPLVKPGPTVMEKMAMIKNKAKTVPRAVEPTNEEHF